MKPELTIQPIEPGMVTALRDAQDRDGHCAPLATHVFFRDSEIVGACGVFAPTFTFWARTDLHPRESVDLAARAKRLADTRGVPYLAACSLESPFYTHMSRLGFGPRLGNLDYFQGKP